MGAAIAGAGAVAGLVVGGARAAGWAAPKLLVGGAKGADCTGAKGCDTTDPTVAGSKSGCWAGMDCRIEAVGAGSIEKGFDAKRVTSPEQPASMMAVALAKARRNIVDEEV